MALPARTLYLEGLHVCVCVLCRALLFGNYDSMFSAAQSPACAVALGLAACAFTPSVISSGSGCLAAVFWQLGFGLGAILWGLGAISPYRLPSSLPARSGHRLALLCGAAGRCYGPLAHKQSILTVNTNARA